MRRPGAAARHSLGYALGLLWIACPLALLVACAPAPLPRPTPVPSATPAPMPTPRSFPLDTIIKRDAIQAIDRPQLYDVAAANAEYRDSEMVIGVSLGGESRAYSTSFLERHEIVNDVIGGQKVVVSWAPLSTSAAAYSRELDGRELTFGSSGQLAMNTPVWYDRQTNSLWSQVTGEAIEGPLAGKTLAFLPVQVTRWTDWRGRHPDTLALVKGTNALFGVYDQYYRSGEAGVTQRVQEDGRLKAKDLVLGVVAGQDAKAYSYAALRREAVMDDGLRIEPVLVVFDAANSLGVAYSRRLPDGRVLSFSPAPGSASANGKPGGTTVVDAETGSTWSGVDGRATAGPLKGTQLNALKSTLMFWFAWKDWYPGAGLVQ